MKELFFRLRIRAIVRSDVITDQHIKLTTVRDASGDRIHASKSYCRDIGRVERAVAYLVNASQWKLALFFLGA